MLVGTRFEPPLSADDRAQMSLEQTLGNIFLNFKWKTCQILAAGGLGVAYSGLYAYNVDRNEWKQLRCDIQEIGRSFGRSQQDALAEEMTLGVAIRGKIIGFRPKYGF